MRTVSESICYHSSHVHAGLSCDCRVKTPNYELFGAMTVDIRVGISGEGWTVNKIQFTYFANTSAKNCLAYGPGLLPQVGASTCMHGAHCTLFVSYFWPVSANAERVNMRAADKTDNKRCSTSATVQLAYSQTVECRVKCMALRCLSSSRPRTHATTSVAAAVTCSRSVHVTVKHHVEADPLNALN